MRDFIDKHAPDLLLLQETHLRPEHSFSIPNYVCYRNDRPNSAHGWGGTAILIKRNISHFHVPTPPLRTGVEATLVALTPNDQEPFMVASIYIPPNPNYRNLIANSTQEIDDQVSNLTTEILNAHASASRPFYQTERPYVQGELKGLIKRSQQAWEDNLLTLNAEDNSLWGIAKAFRKKASPISALNGPTGIALSDTNKTEIFPKSWKTAVVVPILKPGKNSALAESYRPISLLPVLSKLAEKIILARLNDYLEREKILIPEQHGFRPRLSTSHQLLRVVEFIKEGNNNDECTAAVFLDIQKLLTDSPGDLVLRVEDSPIIRQKRKRFSFPKGNPPEITLQNQRIPWSQHTKYLGVIIDKTLTFRQHITYIRDKFKNTTLFVEDDSKVFYDSGPWNRVVLDVDWQWFTCVASCGEEDCFSFRWVYGDFGRGGDLDLDFGGRREKFRITGLWSEESSIELMLKGKLKLLINAKSKVCVINLKPCPLERTLRKKEVGDSFGTGLPAPSEKPPRLNFARKERIFGCICLRMCGPIRGQPMITLREWVSIDLVPAS
ncbi:putative RNA-directed DNA polymerase from transposon X-element, partial [Trichonephila clavipes]